MAWEWSLDWDQLERALSVSIILQKHKHLK